MKRGATDKSCDEKPGVWKLDQQASGGLRKKRVDSCGMLRANDV